MLPGAVVDAAKKHRLGGEAEEVCGDISFRLDDPDPKGRASSATKRYELAIASDPRSELVYLKKGLCAYTLEEYAAAIRDYTTYLRSTDGRADAWTVRNRSFAFILRGFAKQGPALTRSAYDDLYRGSKGLGKGDDAVRSLVAFRRAVLGKRIEPAPETVAEDLKEATELFKRRGEENPPRDPQEAMALSSILVLLADWTDARGEKRGLLDLAERVVKQAGCPENTLFRAQLLMTRADAAGGTKEEHFRAIADAGNARRILDELRRNRSSRRATPSCFLLPQPVTSWRSVPIAFPGTRRPSPPAMRPSKPFSPHPRRRSRVRRGGCSCKRTLRNLGCTCIAAPTSHRVGPPRRALPPTGNKPRIPRRRSSRSWRIGGRPRRGGGPFWPTPMAIGSKRTPG